MDSIEKLRYYIDHGINHRDELIKLTDEIEREIAEKYMELPVDADGVPIHLGDELDNINKSERYKVTSIGDCGYILIDSDTVWIHSSHCRHVKPRTLRDILFDFMHDCETSELGNSELVEKYEVELRELLGGDAE